MLKKILHFILSHSIFISLCAAALSFQTLQLLALAVDPLLLLFIFFATMGGYNAYWLTSKYWLNKHVSVIQFLRKQQVTVLLITISTLGMLYCMLHLHLVMYNIIITFFLLMLYGIPLVPLKKIQFVRQVGFMKTVLLAFTWAHVTTLIPLQISITAMSRAEVLIFILRFLFMLVLCIIFDKRDVAMDKIRGLHSLATDIQSRLIHLLIIVVLIGYALSAYSLKYYGVTQLQVIALLVTGGLTGLLYFQSIQKRGYYFYYFLVDGMMLFSAFLSYLASI